MSHPPIPRIRPIPRTLAHALLLTTVATSCVDGSDSPSPEAMSWPEFRAASTVRFEGRELYTIEGDLPVTLDELRAYYDEHVAPSRDGVVAQHSIVNAVNNTDDIWRNGQQLNLTYCISTEYGTDHARVVSEMSTATADWENVASVNFTYVPQHDTSCNTGNLGVLFSVRPWTGDGALAFFPSSGQGDRSLFMNFASFSGPSRTTGVFRHELGHTLGLRHEHLRTGGNCPDEDDSWRPLTEYDRASVMHYNCNNVPANNNISTLDAEGASSLYGPRPARPNLVIDFMGCGGGVPRFGISLRRIRGVAPTRHVIEVLAGGTTQWRTIHDGPSNIITYTGVKHRGDTVRGSSCNSAGCSGDQQELLIGDCDQVPL